MSDELPPGITLDDFFAFMPKHEYIFRPTGGLWPAASINGRLPLVPILQADGTPVMVKGKPKLLKPSIWLDQNRPVEAMSWSPSAGELIPDRLPLESGWIERAGASTFNRYRPPLPHSGRASGAKRWIKLIRKLYPDDAEHITMYCAHLVQRPGCKINHGIVLAGAPGIGKDSLLEPLRLGVGSANFGEASPHAILGIYNGFMQAVVLRISEIKDQGDVDRYKLYEKMKTLLATPPEMIWINIKYIGQFYIENVCGVFITTNHQYDGLYLPADDRRHYVAATEVRQEDFPDGYWPELYQWYANGGAADVVAYLAKYDISKFDPKAAPKKTAAFWQMVGAGVPTEASEINDALDKLGGMEGAKDKNGKPCGPAAVTVAMLHDAAEHELKEWLRDRKNRRAIPHRLMTCGYLPVLTTENRGRWIIKGVRHAMFARRELAPAERFVAAEKLKERLEQEHEDNVKRFETLKQQEEERQRQGKDGKPKR